MPKIDFVKSKIADADALMRLINVWRFQSNKIVFTNGCFDLLHKGHLHLLLNATNSDEKLIVAINSDKSVRKLKGSSRPIMDEESRLLLVASLSYVDAVILFEEDTPLELIKLIKPDFIVKGGDYKEEDVVGADFIKEYNGEVRIIDLLEGFATSSIEEKIRNASES
ncbi:MAG: D-glycero-beta-D-manno-heptose 1-phosphate adenylyltransferase [Chitinophagaceae bacterium]|nr:MAG: D-glycero-beta-D-manno-heptose 1-phosphate adenylyltransferase [Chitinophagaceae bacterium]